jgi:flagellum-specific ATP synthase
MSDIVDSAHKQSANALRRSLAVYHDAEDLINVGAYVKGSNPDIDKAISLIGGINAFLQQDVFERFTYLQTVEALKASIGGS